MSASTKTIVLAHGLFGFGELIHGFSLPNYFNGIKGHLESHGHTVIAKSVAATGSIQERGDELAGILKDIGPGPKHIIAHSMGGLDARHAITNKADIVQNVKTLVTIGTPHRGSEVADAVVDSAGPLVQIIPSLILAALRAKVGAFRDLTTRKCIAFDDSTGDAPGVRYIEVAGDASKASNELGLFDLAAKIGRITNQTNDGVVTRNSALRQVQGHEHLEDWPVDHLGEIGWSTGLVFHTEAVLKEHFDRYDAIVAMLRD
jgi:triacylglycerol lipase